VSFNPISKAGFDVSIRGMRKKNRWQGFASLEITPVMFLMFVYRKV